MPWYWKDQEKEKMTEYTNSEMCRVIDEHIHSARDRDILKDRFINGLTFEQLSERHDYSVRQIKNIVYKSADKLFSKLNIA